MLAATAAVSITGYIPMQAATSGTLSITDDSMPMTPAMVNTSCTCLSSQFATSVSTPAVCSAATDIRIPRKKRIVGMSICLSTFVTRHLIDSSMPRLRS